MPRVPRVPRPSLARVSARLPARLRGQADLGSRPAVAPRIVLPVRRAVEPEPFTPRGPGRQHAGANAADSVSWPFRVTAAWAWRGIAIAVALYLTLQVIGRVSLIVYSLLVAILLAALLAPAVSALRAIGLSRALSASLVFVGGIVTVAAIFYALVSALAEELPELAVQVEEGIAQVREWLRDGPLALQQSQIDDYAQQAQEWVRGNQGELTSATLGAAGTVGTLGTGLALTLFTVFFFLYDGRRIWAWVVRLFPRSAEEGVYEAGDRAWTTLVGYVRGVVLVAAIDGIGIGIWLAVLGVPLAVPLGILVFFGAFVPLVGAFVTGLIAVLVALVTNGPAAALLAFAGIVVVQQIEGNLLQPLIMSRFVQLHPLAVVLAVTAGGILAGIGGAVIAVPLAAVLNVVGNYFASLYEAESDHGSGEPTRSVEQVAVEAGHDGPGGTPALGSPGPRQPPG